MVQLFAACRRFPQLSNRSSIISPHDIYLHI